MLSILNTQSTWKGCEVRKKLNFSENLRNWVEDKSISSISYFSVQRLYILFAFFILPLEFRLPFLFSCVLRWLNGWNVRNNEAWKRLLRVQSESLLWGGMRRRAEKVREMFGESWKEFNMWKKRVNRKKKPEIVRKIEKKNSLALSFDTNERTEVFPLWSFDAAAVRHINQTLQGRRRSLLHAES